MRYQIVRGDVHRLDWFTNEVESLIKQGWWMVGGVAVHGSTVSQAMATDSEKKSDQLELDNAHR